MHPSRRRKKRPNYGLRTVEVMRGPNGFGFTISGQQPCILSCIVSGSPADQGGLRAGDFLISVNGVSVSKVTHDAVVSLIGNCVGPIKMTIAENYYSDSSDEELECGRVMNSRKPKYMHKPRPRAHKGDLRRTAVETNEKNNCKSRQAKQPLSEKPPENELNISGPMPMEDQAGPIEYRALVGYLGTIEMPNQLLPHNRLQTVCSCIRKLRQEKRLPTAVLMTILPTCLTLKNASNHILAIYPTNRVTYVGTTADRESRYFGLVTSATCDLRNIVNLEKRSSSTGENCVEISNSCHVFVTDPKIVDHNVHKKKAELFKITCTTNPVTGNCLEFPQSALYVVSLIQNMYKLQSNHKNNGHISPVIANSPQPSASSNSDSGIGFRDDCGNISDRILVVEFPMHRPLPVLNSNNRPTAIDAANVNLEDLDVPLAKDQSRCLLNNVRSQKQDNLNNIRACEGVKIKNQLDNFNKTVYLSKYNNHGNQTKLITKPVSSKATRTVSPSSSEDNTKIRDTDFFQKHHERTVDALQLIPNKKLYESMSLNSITDCEFIGSTDNLSVHSSKSLELSNLFNVFKVPFDRKIKRQLKNANSCDNLDKYNENILNYKLGPKTYGMSKQNYSCEELNAELVDTKTFGSLQDLSSCSENIGKRRNIVAQSEPDIRVSTPTTSSTFSWMGV
ncbi:unnamed protein product [Acanthoscelides obtectus]|uniref:Regulator of G-protein signaling loco n=1 Tax=Acanthoscelides obtectus TaxID=200917 RepID=A0A9P0M6F6_ACAOB|nr:unnamed protein product [Acanthoscelides obtectus]CAK1656607.1 Regulator of G-protein signaling loco [Acanthoscelides obtectus]